MDAAASQKEIEDGLKECGNRLINLRPDDEELISLIDTQTENVTDAVYPKKVGTSDAVICETLLEDGTPSNNNVTSSKVLQHRSQMEQLKSTGVRNSSHGRRHRAKKKDSRENKDDVFNLRIRESHIM